MEGLTDRKQGQEMVGSGRPLGRKCGEHPAAADEGLKIALVRGEMTNDLMREPLLVANPLEQLCRERPYHVWNRLLIKQNRLHHSRIPDIAGSISSFRI